MASEKDLELLDLYVSNRLTAADKAAFEQKLASDASLKSEFKLQQKLVERIREARVKELKTMFNNVPASALEPSGTSIATQVTLWIAIVGAIGAGVYLYLRDPADQPVAKQEEVITETPKITPQEDQSRQEAPKLETPAESSPAEQKTDTTTPHATPSIDNKQQDSKGPQADDDAKIEEESKGPAPLDIFDPSEEGEAANEKATPESKTSESPLHKSSIVVEVDNSNKKYNFHYQFKNGKLYLFGAFEKNLYEIMEFFSGNKRTVFLFYKDNYYLLSEENDTIKPLSAINDPNLLQKLRDYRGTR